MVVGNGSIIGPCTQGDKSGIANRDYARQALLVPPSSELTLQRLTQNLFAISRLGD